MKEEVVEAVRVFCSDGTPYTALVVVVGGCVCVSLGWMMQVHCERQIYSLC